jgi:hypothetical protein
MELVRPQDRGRPFVVAQSLGRLQHEEVDAEAEGIGCADAKHEICPVQ